MDTENFTDAQKRTIIQHLLITHEANSITKKYSHVPCKFFKKGKCQASATCPFSHSIDFHDANRRPCKYYKLGNCKFGNKCANLHDVSASNSDSNSNSNINHFRNNSDTDNDVEFLKSIDSYGTEPNYITNNTNYLGHQRRTSLESTSEVMTNNNSVSPVFDNNSLFSSMNSSETPNKFNAWSNTNYKPRNFNVDELPNVSPTSDYGRDQFKRDFDPIQAQPRFNNQNCNQNQNIPFLFEDITSLKN